jgi:prepilin-type N-terminal cleavage/methylation domain-containing protein
MKSDVRRQKGFTLIEVMITIIIVALAGLVVFTYLGNILTKSHIPLEHTRDLAESVEAMEEIVVEYSEYVKGGRDSSEWSNFISVISGEEELTSGDLVVLRDDAGLDFDIYKVTVTRNNQTITALFTE